MSTLTPDELLAEWLRRFLRTGGVSIEAPGDVEEHLRACPSLAVTEAEGSTGSYGCSTGCEYVTLTAQVVCEHHPGPFEVSYGEFGDMSSIIAELADLDVELSAVSGDG